MTLIPLPAFNDNYIWMLHDGQRALVVDPGDGAVVLQALEQLRVELQGILITHHHGDHTGGVAQLHDATGAPVFGPRLERLPEPVTRVAGADQVTLLDLCFDVIDVPGHTAGHIAFFAQPQGAAPLLFCGDTLFSAGCGRLFEGTAEQMLTSLSRLAALPAATRVCCAHEYTLSGLQFARTVEPDNPFLISYQTRARALREQGVPTLPSSIELEKQINPFLRTQEPGVAAAARRFDPSAQSPAEIFAALRTWKNQF